MYGRMVYIKFVNITSIYLCLFYVSTIKLKQIYKIWKGKELTKYNVHIDDDTGAHTYNIHEFYASVNIQNRDQDIQAAKLKNNFILVYLVYF